MTRPIRPCQWCGKHSPATPLFEGKYACTKDLTELMAARRRTEEEDARVAAVAAEFNARLAAEPRTSLYATRVDLRGVRYKRQTAEADGAVLSFLDRTMPRPARVAWTPTGVRVRVRPGASA